MVPSRQNTGSMSCQRYVRRRVREGHFVTYLVRLPDMDARREEVLGYEARDGEIQRESGGTQWHPLLAFSVCAGGGSK